MDTGTLSLVIIVVAAIGYAIWIVVDLARDKRRWKR